VTETTLSYDELLIAPTDVYEQMGYGSAMPDGATQRETAIVTGEVQHWLRPAFSYDVVERLPDFNLGTVISRQLRGAEAYALFVCTAGQEYEDYQQRLKEQGDMVRMYIADALGSVIAEKCADQMELHLQQSIDKLGWHRTNRFSPGYCGWHVAEQQRLFTLFGGHTSGVTLTPSSLMIPIKSVSGIIGLGHNVLRTDYTCGLCGMKNCYKRRSRP
jgi:hypothetical protein